MRGVIPAPGVLTAVAYGAGLATGLLHFWAPACVLAAVAILMARDSRARLAAGAVAAGALTGFAAAARSDRSCAALLPAGRIELDVHAADAGGGRGLVRARLPRAGCAGTIDARWPRGARVSAGTEGRVIGRWLPREATGGRPGGILVVSRLDTLAIQPSLSERLRNSIVWRAERLYGSRAPLVEALVLGTRGTLDPDMRDAFAHAGLVHLLSISGFHVGLLSAWVVLAARLAGARRSRALAFGACAGIAYVAFLGWPAPGARAASLAAVLALLYRRQRRASANALLAQTCLLVLVIAPWSVFDLGGWLSAAALWGATTATRWTDRTFGEGFLPRTLGSSVGATLATAPITAATFGAVALAGIGLNLVAIPLAAIAVPGVGASLLAASVSDGLASRLAAGSGLALNLLELLADAGARFPGGHLLVAAEPRAALPWLALVGAALWMTGRRNTRAEAGTRLLVGLTLAAWVSLGLGIRPPSADATHRLTLHFLNVGQGDGAAIRTPGGRWVVIDAGPRGGGSDAGRRIVAPFLARQGARRIAALVISHAHLDHLGGADALLARFATDLVLEPADVVADPAYTTFLGTVAAGNVAWRAARPGMEFVLDSVRFRVLHPDTTWSEWGADVNEGSVVLRVDYGSFSALFAGDAGLRAEARLAGRVGTVDVLKVGHHGSRGSSSERWLRELAPRVAVISVGRNRYGHPAPEALGRLAESGADIWRTDREGSVTIASDGATMSVQGRRGTVTYRVD